MLLALYFVIFCSWAQPQKKFFFKSLGEDVDYKFPGNCYLIEPTELPNIKLSWFQSGH